MLMLIARRTSPPRARAALGAGLAGLLALTGVTALAGTADAATTLASAAAAKGRYFGTATPPAIGACTAS
ncbi:hypothetical protein SUDANB6_00843 [Streptomyces sp. enrichment culture]|uniref:hypothetical protein n=1 Tax=Streptomyces sp. enrichment culture TaxID=1795815 RepID=UPI003F557541